VEIRYHRRQPVKFVGENVVYLLVWLVVGYDKNIQRCGDALELVFQQCAQGQNKLGTKFKIAALLVFSLHSCPKKHLFSSLEFCSW